MLKHSPTNQKGSHDTSHHVRPKHIDVGTDASGREHCYDTVTETVHIIEDGARAKRVDLVATDGIGSIEDYIAKYGGADDRDWADLRYGRDALWSRLGELV